MACDGLPPPRVSTRGRMHIKARFIGKQVIFEDAVEAGPIGVRQEHVVRAELRVDRIDTPIEHDGRTGIVQPLQAISRRLVRQ